jgi:hypothetical protein
MKRGIGLALFSVLSVSCLFAYTFDARNRSTEGGRPHRHAKAEPVAGAHQTIENSLDANFEEANATTDDEPSPRKLAARARGRHASAAHARQASPEETPDAQHSASGSGGGEVLLSPTRGACAPDSFTVQPCSFDEWTYTFPQD